MNKINPFKIITSINKLKKVFISRKDVINPKFIYAYNKKRR
jgi:hypothetical protein